MVLLSGREAEDPMRFKSGVTLLQSVMICCAASSADVDSGWYAVKIRPAIYQEILEQLFPAEPPYCSTHSTKTAIRWSANLCWTVQTLLTWAHRGSARYYQEEDEKPKNTDEGRRLISKQPGQWCHVESFFQASKWIMENYTNILLFIRSIFLLLH